jgi:DNA-binding NarL/FixJ family response regulator
VATFRLVTDPARLPEPRPGLHVAEVTDAAGAEAAVLAALGGADLALACTCDPEVSDRLLEDLARLGSVCEEPAEQPLTADQAALLARLRDGATLAGAARAEHLSRRTADRRLAAARRALGARTTAEALVTAARLGLLD